ncbi:MAG: hypothetical protein WCI12_08250 [Actinomycetes bacterium]
MAIIRNSRTLSALRTAGVLVAAGALAAACSSGGSGSSSSTTSGGSSNTKVDNTLALAYTGGKAGAADSMATPVKIGYVNQQFGSPSFPENTAGAALAVKYINKELGGVKGHPLELVSCYVSTEEDGQKCGTQMLNDSSIHLVVTGTLTVGNDSLYKVLGGQKPIIIGNGLTATDFAQATAETYMPGAPGTVSGMAKWLVDGGLGKIKTVAVVATNDAGATASAKILFAPPLEKAGITVKEVFIDPAAQGADVASAVKAAGGGTADVFVPITPVQGCIAVYDALKSLGIHPQVLTTGLCFGTPLIQHLGGTFPNNWYFGAYGVNYFVPPQKDVPASEELAAYQDVVKKYNPTMEYTGFAGPSFGNLLTITQMYNKLGVDASIPQLMDATKNFAGPQWGIPGPVACGKITPLFPAVCVGEMGIEQFKDGKWIPIADAYNGKMINAFG